MAAAILMRISEKQTLFLEEEKSESSVEYGFILTDFYSPKPPVGWGKPMHFNLREQSRSCKRKAKPTNGPAGKIHVTVGKDQNSLIY